MFLSLYQQLYDQHVLLRSPSSHCKKSYIWLITHLHNGHDPRTWNTRPKTPVTAISLDERHTGVHTSHTTWRPRHLSIVRKEELVRKINEYAKRGTLYAETCRRTCRSSLWWRIGVNRDSRLIQRRRDIIHWSFSSYKKLGHLQANTPETRRSFRHIVPVFLVVLKTN